MKRQKGFTLIELITVIMIIMALAGLLLTGVHKARQRALISTTQTAIATIETAISMYETDYGDYPPSGNANMVTALTTDPSDSAWRGPYMLFDEEDLSGGAFLDPWGNSYSYTNNTTGSPGHNGANYVDIYSTGPNGSGDGTEDDDINNW